ncbi:MAG: Asp-tRNA(Asn)/Glu-tRNA(Gln) amidotransferase subunit GatC [Candidatus Parcubacteria bacterium]|jgi:aspartyl-tRNA(Asn)/glutamyl-tRNA(Gln) amidotransferase subunit C
MTVEEIKHLGHLSRLALDDKEALAFSQEIEAILAYVGTVSAMAGDGALPKNIGVVHNVFRSDEVTVTPGSYTEALLEAAPDRAGAYIRVQKIIGQSES